MKHFLAGLLVLLFEGVAQAQFTGANIQPLLGGGGGGGTVGPGTINTIPKFTAANVVGNSNATDDGTTFTISEDLKIGGGVAASRLMFLEPSGSGTNVTTFQAQAMAADVAYILPAAQGAASTFLQNNGAGTLTWAAAGTVGPGTINTVAKFTGANAVGNSSITDTGAIVSTPSSVGIANSGPAAPLSVGAGATVAAGIVAGYDIVAAGSGLMLMTTNTGYSEQSIETYSNTGKYSAMILQTARGTYAVPLKTQTGDIVGGLLQFMGQSNAGVDSGYPGAVISAVATENWNGTAGTKMTFGVNATGTAANPPPVVLTLENSGDLTMNGDFNWLPATDNNGSVGTNAKRFKLVRAVTITSGDIGFDDDDCAICHKRFEEGDDIVMHARRRVTPEDGKPYILTVPVHLGCRVVEVLKHSVGLQ